MIEITLKIDSSDIQKLNIPSTFWDALANNRNISIGNEKKPKGKGRYRTEEYHERHHSKQMSEYDYGDSKCTAVERVINVLQHSHRPLTRKELMKQAHYSRAYMDRILWVLQDDGLLDVGIRHRRGHYRENVYSISRNWSERGLSRRLQQLQEQYKTKLYSRGGSVTAKRKVLKAILSVKRPVTSKDLVRMCEYTYTYVQRVLFSLRREGLVESVKESAKSFHMPTEKALAMNN